MLCFFYAQKTDLLNNTICAVNNAWQLHKIRTDSKENIIAVLLIHMEDALDSVLDSTLPKHVQLA